jgi:hypothetical protein
LRKEGEKEPTHLKSLVAALLALTLGASSALAEVETCRFVPAKAEREACYQRQEAALAEKRKQAVARDAAMTSSSTEQMSADDAALKATLRSICRGC